MGDRGTHANTTVCSATVKLPRNAYKEKKNTMLFKVVHIYFSSSSVKMSSLRGWGVNYSKQMRPIKSVQKILSVLTFTRCKSYKLQIVRFCLFLEFHHGEFATIGADI